MKELVESIVGNVSDNIKYGSSRAVFFPQRKRTIILDGIETQIETVLKLAVPHKYITGNLDLGKYQNKTEIDCSNHQKYNLFVKNSDNTYTTNYESGILCTIFDYAEDYSWVEMLKVDPISIPIFNRLTGNSDFPAGLHAEKAKSTVRKYHSKCTIKDGEFHPEYIDDIQYEKLITHPWIKKYCDFMMFSGLLPIDFNPNNIGYTKHPITKEEFIILCDYGLTEEYHDLCEKLTQSA